MLALPAGLAAGAGTGYLTAYLLLGFSVRTWTNVTLHAAVGKSRKPFCFMHPRQLILPHR